jgi:hypothetical protein
MYSAKNLEAENLVSRTGSVAYQLYELWQFIYSLCLNVLISELEIMPSLYKKIATKIK